MDPAALRLFRLVIVRIALAVLALLAGAPQTGCAPRITDDVVTRIDSAELRRRLDRNDLTLIDARDAAEYSIGRIDGAVNIRLAEVGASAQNVPFGRRRTIVVYGRNPGDGSALALSKRLISAGYKNVLYYAGGWDAWSGGRAGSP